MLKHTQVYSYLILYIFCSCIYFVTSCSMYCIVGGRGFCNSSRSSWRSGLCFLCMVLYYWYMVGYICVRSVALVGDPGSVSCVWGGNIFCRSSRSSWRLGPFERPSDQMAFYWRSSVDQRDANSTPQENEARMFRCFSLD